MKIRLSVLLTFSLMLGSLSIGFADSKAKQDKKASSCSQKLDKSIERYGKGKYGDVILQLAELKVQCSGHEVMDSIIYYLGMAYMHQDRIAEAKFEFQQLIRDFPRSPFAHEARFRIGHASFVGSNSYERDQTETKNAVRELSQFIEMNPESEFRDSAALYLDQAVEKLAKKEFMSARFYEKMEEYESAVIYYRVFLEEFPDSKFAPDARISMAEDLIKINRVSEAEEVLEEMVKADYPKDIQSRAQSLLDKIRKKG